MQHLPAYAVLGHGPQPRLIVLYHDPGGCQVLIDVKIEDREVRDLLRKIMGRIGNLKLAMAEIGLKN